MPIFLTFTTRQAPYFSWVGTPTDDYPLTLEVDPHLAWLPIYPDFARAAQRPVGVGGFFFPYSDAQTVQALSASLALSAGAPTVVPGTATISALSASLALSAGAPTVVQDIDALSASLALDAGAPTVQTTNTIDATTASLALAFGLPTVTFAQEIDALVASINLTAGAPTVISTQVINALSAALALSAGAPQVNQSVSGMSATIALAAGAPTVVRGTWTISALSASLSLSAGAPFLVYAQAINATSAAISLTAGVPTVGFVLPQPSPSEIEVQGLGSFLTLSRYVMRAFHTAVPIGYVYWSVSEAPDSGGTQAPYPPVDLTDIVVIKALNPS